MEAELVKVESKVVAVVVVGEDGANADVLEANRENVNAIDVTFMMTVVLNDSTRSGRNYIL